MPIDKSLFFCAFCFAISAGLYAFSLLLRNKVISWIIIRKELVQFQIACTEYNDNLLYAVRGLLNTKCTLMATLLYYFGSAGRLWWLMICIGWRWSMKEHSLADMVRSIFLNFKWYMFSGKVYFPSSHNLLGSSSVLGDNGIDGPVCSSRIRLWSLFSWISQSSSVPDIRCSERAFDNAGCHFSSLFWMSEFGP